MVTGLASLPRRDAGIGDLPGHALRVYYYGSEQPTTSLKKSAPYHKPNSGRCYPPNIIGGPIDGCGRRTGGYVSSSWGPDPTF
ncbi:hypothetical protein PAXRUDRAFT_653032 [Paxillus rubicundulus Ve08.2h10]|uniref:Uncharacterized protein n=1 Tax=Paxillus rubicundulus Ve08.2h10 TaxID=930991 RepID=A0A0D0DSE4_9AGAM|nr:hypothetical protein PAXRUDRAFT_653032 [Paxillus rubicundulus Ve08.2h10]